MRPNRHSLPGLELDGQVRPRRLQVLEHCAQKKRRTSTRLLNQRMKSPHPHFGADSAILAAWAGPHRSGNTTMPRYLMSVYYAIVTLTTLGYGDVLPTNEARTFLILLHLSCCVRLLFSCAFFVSSTSPFLALSARLYEPQSDRAWRLQLHRKVIYSSRLYIFPSI